MICLFTSVVKSPHINSLRVLERTVMKELRPINSVDDDEDDRLLLREAFNAQWSIFVSLRL